MNLNKITKLPCSSLVCTENQCLQPQAVRQHPGEYQEKIMSTNTNYNPTQNDFPQEN